MRKIVFLLLIAFAVESSAQREDKRPASNPYRKGANTLFGFVGGYNKSMIRGKDSYHLKTGYIGYELYAGFFADTRLNDHWRFENELLFSWTDDYHFIEIPIHLKYRFANKWAAFAGPKIDFICDNDNLAFEDRYQFANLGVSVDAGLQYSFKKWLLLETRYSRGFVRQVDDHMLDILGGKRNTFRIGVGIVF